MGTRIRPAVGSLLLVAVSIRVSLALTEVALRLLGHHGEPISRISNIYLVDDPLLDWRYVPNSEGSGTEPERESGRHRRQWRVL